MWLLLIIFADRSTISEIITFRSTRTSHTTHLKKILERHSWMQAECLRSWPANCDILMCFSCKPKTNKNKKTNIQIPKPMMCIELALPEFVKRKLRTGHCRFAHTHYIWMCAEIVVHKLRIQTLKYKYIYIVYLIIKRVS